MGKGKKGSFHEKVLCGTSSNSYIWLVHDYAGGIMAVLVWCLFLFAAFFIVWLAAEVHSVSWISTNAFLVVWCMSLWAHWKCMLTDPGAVPPYAEPPLPIGGDVPETVCGRCDNTFKPARAHHCRICGRCIVRMDHHCPWMNNCVGIGNQKHFILFLGYTFTTAVFAMAIIIVHYIRCETQSGCIFYPGYVSTLSRILLMISFAAALFTFSMFMNQIKGVVSGLGTVDRMQARRRGVGSERGTPADYVPLNWEDVMGAGNKLCWLIPTDPVIREPDRVLGYSVREESIEEGAHEP